MQSDLIFDVGMNNGDDTAYYLHKGFRVVAIEADPSLVDRARGRFREAIAAKRLELVNVAVGPRDEMATFWICQTHDDWNSFDREIAARDGHEPRAIDVRCEPFHSLLARYGVPFYLKIDIEGHDHYCLNALNAPDRPRYVSCEIGSESIMEGLYHLRAIGYDRFKLITQNTHAALTPHPTLRSRVAHSRLGRALRKRTPIWHFPFGSSGPFGEETDGAWMSFDTLLQTWEWFQTGRSPLGVPGLTFWHDVHARAD